MGNFGGRLFSPFKSIVNLCYGVRCKRDHSIINGGMQQKGSFNTPGRYHIKFSRREESAPAMRPFVKILGLLVNEFKYLGIVLMLDVPLQFTRIL